MNIARKNDAETIIIGPTLTAYEYPVLDKTLHGTVMKLKGRYPVEGRVMNEICTEIGYVIEGSGKLILEGEEIKFEAGDQILIKPGERYYWEADATLFMPCAPAWYPEQHKEVE
ncbi:cupin domain-containing protein [Candidatus Roizmanbacteria bacterium]|nr:cupin domain-containing protein [Candidatus Roizmanbacteria bacterium]